MNGSIGCWVDVDVAKSKLDVALLDEHGKLKAASSPTKPRDTRR